VLTACAALGLAAPVAVTAADAPPGARYSGSTDEGLRVALRISDDGDRIARVRIRFEVTCDNGASGRVTTTVFRIPIGANGTFSYRGTYRKKVDRSTNHVKMTGTVGRRVAKGTFRLRAVGHPGGSERKVHCHSRRVTWRADRV
jgi:hypothetical protein